MEINTILLIVWLHFVADFLFQSDEVAKSKSTSNMVLWYHVTLYMIPFALVFGPVFALFNMVLHGITDYFTSRGTSYLYKAGHRHWFFVLIGFDQAIHFTCLFVTYQYLIG